MVLVDTGIWSLALRRKRAALSDGERALVREWFDLVRSGRARAIGTIRQEVLSGIRSQEIFDTLRRQLDGIDDLDVTTEDHIQAARNFNRCRAAGVTGGHADLLISAVAIRHEEALFTIDEDFAELARVLPLRFYAVGNA